MIGKIKQRYCKYENALFQISRRRHSLLMYSRKVSLSEIEKNDFNLNISRYVSTAEKDAILDLADVKKNLHSIRNVDIN
ncbi:N-6 DNA methylase [Scatolibacter rhodanostii]|uniref:N-6 DNA methylase n=1 Tax=Scatolibacter rhodanostii TaxID=2014781 RepID=UPI00117F684E|nr:N-6 DNA methylase [Scatolibacter rhodanostii]